MKKLLMTASVYSHIRNFHLPYLKEFQRLGWETHVGCKGIPPNVPYVDKVIELPFKKRMSSLSNLRAAKLLQQRMKEEYYDLIITHTALAAFFTRLAAKGIKDRNTRLINVCHGYLFDENTSILKRHILLKAERFTAPQTDLLLTMNKWDYKTAKEYRLAKKIEIIQSIGVDFTRLDKATEEDGLRLREQLGIPKNAFVLIYPAEFSKRKSQHVLIEAMISLPQNAVLVLCGTGELLEKCRELADRLKARDRVFFPGHIGNMAVWYRMSDASVTSSRSEGLPFNVMEAMYCGLPVVASAVKGHVDLVSDGETGLLYEYGDADACAECVKRVMSDEVLRERLKVKARKSVERYGLDEVLGKVMENYLSL